MVSKVSSILVYKYDHSISYTKYSLLKHFQLKGHCVLLIALRGDSTQQIPMQNSTGLCYFFKIFRYGKLGSLPDNFWVEFAFLKLD